VLSATVIEERLEREIGGWLDLMLWNRRSREIEQARALL
jgi:hypothetical protein